MANGRKVNLNLINNNYLAKKVKGYDNNFLLIKKIDDYHPPPHIDAKSPKMSKTWPLSLTGLIV